MSPEAQTSKSISPATKHVSMPKGYDNNFLKATLRVNLPFTFQKFAPPAFTIYPHSSREKDVESSRVRHGRYTFEI